MMRWYIYIYLWYIYSLGFKNIVYKTEIRIKASNGVMFTRVLLSLFSLFVGCYTFNVDSQCRKGRCELTMKWMFTKGTGSLQDLGGIGAQGEYYYIPSKKPTLKAPESVLGNTFF